MADTPKPKYDVCLIGAGIMSATLAVLLHELCPELKIVVLERLEDVAQESSAAFNNAGTGHSAYCELNYTPEDDKGNVDITKALKICEQFEVSKQFWSFLVEQNYIQNPKDFINTCPHLSWVDSEKDVTFLKKRYAKMQAHHFFSEMQYTEDFSELEKWMPLMMKNKSKNEKMAATRSFLGTDVDFGFLTKSIFYHLQSKGVEIYYNHEVENIDPKDQQWRIFLKDKEDFHDQEVRADFVFIGAGGYALPLLDSSEIPESDGYGGFPVSGQWLISKNPDLIAQHQAKVYTQASVDSPPMSVPHLDLRIINGEKYLLFGPFAGFTTKFLNEGNILDLAKSIDLDNIPSMLGAFVHNLPLTKYLIQQVLLSKEERIEELRKFVADADEKDWELIDAGKRVQIIKKDAKQFGKLEFGTEVVVNKDGNIASLLGASPGASTSVSAMLQVLEKCFSKQISESWKDKLQIMIPSYGKSLSENKALTEEIRKFTKDKLQLEY